MSLQTAAAAIILITVINISHLCVNKNVAKVRPRNADWTRVCCAAWPCNFTPCYFLFFKARYGKTETGATVIWIVWMHVNTGPSHARLTLSLGTQTTLSQKPSKPLRIWEERGLLVQRVSKQYVKTLWAVLKVRKKGQKYNWGDMVLKSFPVSKLVGIYPG